MIKLEQTIIYRTATLRIKEEMQLHSKSLAPVYWSLYLFSSCINLSATLSGIDIMYLFYQDVWSKLWKDQQRYPERSRERECVW